MLKWSAQIEALYNRIQGLRIDLRLEKDARKHERALWKTDRQGFGRLLREMSIVMDKLGRELKTLKQEADRSTGEGTTGQ